jgi:hypothetical protein
MDAKKATGYFNSTTPGTDALRIATGRGLTG